MEALFMLVGVILQFVIGINQINKKKKSWFHLIGIVFLGWIWVIVLVCSSDNSGDTKNAD